MDYQKKNKIFGLLSLFSGSLLFFYVIAPFLMPIILLILSGYLMYYGLQLLGLFPIMRLLMWRLMSGRGGF